MRAKLTKSFVDALEPDADPRKRLTVWDIELPAFGVAVTPPGRRGGGVKSYLVQYRMGGRGTPTRRVTIGHHGREWQPGAAREEAREILRLVRRGVDPFEERQRMLHAELQARGARESAEERASRLTYSAISAEFIERYAKGSQPSSWRNTERALKDLERDLRGKRLDSVERDEVRRALERITKRSPSAGIEAHKALRRMFGWAVAEQIIPAAAHPMMLMEPPAKGRKRLRVLTSVELREVWEAAGRLDYPFGQLVRRLILTGSRLREVANAVRGELHLAHRVWIIPKARMKREADDDRGDHLVPLSGLDIDVLEGLPIIAPPAGVKIKAGERPLFTTDGTRPVAGFSNMKSRMDAEIAIGRKGSLPSTDPPLEMPHWTNHDLRRTMATALQALGVDEKIIDLLHDHRVPGTSAVGRHYQLWGFHAEKAEAIAVWERYLRAALFGDDRYVDLVEKVDFKLLVPR